MLNQCASKRQHMKKYCGSYAVNDDPERRLCDVCYAYHKGQEDMREQIVKVLEDLYAEEPLGVLVLAKQKIETLPIETEE